MACITDAQNLHDRFHVEVLQDQTQMMLHEYCAIRQNTRFGKLLLLLKSLGSFDSRTTEKLFFDDDKAGGICVKNIILETCRA